MYDATGEIVARAESMTHMTTDTVEHAVEIFVAARQRRQRVPVLPAAGRPVSLDDACIVQAALNERLGGALGGVCGRKIGCTTEVMQRYLQIEHPCAGALYADQVRHREATVPFAEHWRPGVECEIAVRLGRSLPASDAPFDRTAVAHAVENGEHGTRRFLPDRPGIAPEIMRGGIVDLPVGPDYRRSARSM